jgi:hypothetical protein
LQAATRILGRASLCALLLLGSTQGQAKTVRDAYAAVEGLWGFELAPDMTCAQNPVLIDVTDSKRQLVFTWPKSVTYSDGSVSDAVTFTILSVKGRTLSLKRESDGVKSSITIARNGQSFQYEEQGPNAGSRFDRCEGISN